jgi:solute carrier family 13 (sodium-dependent dicarboxylate transporter), member 2/3/5
MIFHVADKWNFWVGLIAIIGAALLVYWLVPESCPEAARRQASILVLAAGFWAFEIIPLYATSLMVVILEILLLGRPGGDLNMGPGGYTVFLEPFASPVIMLFLGGFILAAAMHKHRVDRVIARRLLRIFGTKPSVILFGFMLITAFFSMWLSNTATTAMLIAMIIPLLGDLDRDDPFRIALPLGIAFSANIGGIGTPVGTPPNAIALGVLAERGIYISFTEWMTFGIPTVIVLIFASHFILLSLNRPKHKSVELKIEQGRPLDSSGFLVAVITLFTILLWISSAWHGLPEAAIALCATAVITGFGLLDRSDLKHIEWDILVLMWGGLALGKGVEISGLADWVLSSPLFSQSGFWMLALFCVSALILSTFISNTASANLILPLTVSLPGVEPRQMAIMVAFSCSLAMALPISTPPNAVAFSTDTFSASDMRRAGLLISIISLLIVLLVFRFVVPV